MPAKNAEKRAVKRTARKLVSHPASDLRRAYELIGRIDILEGALAGSPFVDVAGLTDLAQQQIRAGEPRNAADLLRAAEHMCFAALAPSHLAATSNNSELQRAISVEFEGLMRRAEERWKDEEALGGRRVIEDLFGRALYRARESFDSGLFRRALELARAADALAQVRGRLPASLPDSALLGRVAS